MSTDEPSPVIACDLTAFDPRQLKRHRTLQAQLQRVLIGTEEVPHERGFVTSKEA